MSFLYNFYAYLLPLGTVCEPKTLITQNYELQVKEVDNVGENTINNLFTFRTPQFAHIGN